MSFEDPANLEFRRRPEQRPRRMESFSSQSVWVVIAIIAAIVFVLFVRAMLERSAWTAGHSTEAVASAVDVPSDAELNAQPWPDLPVPDSAASRAPIVDRTSPRTAVVYRCVGTDGVVAFRSEPCAGAERTTRIVDATPEPQRRPRRQGLSSSMQYSYAVRTPDARDQQRARCAAARRHRDQTLEQVGLARTFDLLRQLDEALYEACKGL